MPSWIADILGKGVIESRYQSSILKTMAYMSAMGIAAILLFSMAGVATWIVSGMAIALFIILAYTVGIHLYCTLKDPDLLRSDRHAIEKMALAKRITGDNLTGTDQTELNEVLLEVQSASTYDISSEKIMLSSEAEGSEDG